MKVKIFFSRRVLGFGLAHHISNAANRDDEAWRFGIIAEFTADGRNVNVD